jgi:hypothetical protein
MDTKRPAPLDLAARDRATRRLNQLTAGVALAGVVAVGGFGALAAVTDRGATTTSAAATTSVASTSTTTAAATPATTSGATTSGTTSTTSTLAAGVAPVAATGAGHATTGGS